MLTQERKNLSRSFEDEAHDRAYEPGQEEAQLLTDSLEPLSYSFGAGFKTVQTSKGKSAKNHAHSQDNSLQGPAVLLEDLFHPLEQGPFAFPSPQPLR